jgi:transposase-like protein
MKRRRHTPDQIVRKLAEADKLAGQGKTPEEVCRHLEVAESTLHRWLELTRFFAHGVLQIMPR